MRVGVLAFLALLLAACNESPPPKFDPELRSATKVVVSFHWRDKTCQIVEVLKLMKDAVLPDDGDRWFGAAKFIDCGDGPIPANYDGGKAGLQ